jgi:hypothetical protein
MQITILHTLSLSFAVHVLSCLISECILREGFSWRVRKQANAVPCKAEHHTLRAGRTGLKHMKNLEACEALTHVCQCVNLPTPSASTLFFNVACLFLKAPRDDDKRT